MSTPNPGPPRRRRIAGERRGGRPLTAEPDGPVSTTEPEARSATPAPPAASRTASTTTSGRPARARREARPGPGPRPAGGWWGSRASLVVLATVLVLAAVLTALLALGLLGNRGIEQVNEAQASESAGLAASAAAERAAGAILAYDARSLDSDQKTAERFMTPSFAAKYATTFEKVVKPAAQDSRAEVTAEVQASSVLRAAPDRVRVLLFVDQTTVSTANEGPQKALNRVEMDMVERSGTWLVDNIRSY